MSSITINNSLEMEVNLKKMNYKRHGSSTHSKLLS